MVPPIFSSGKSSKSNGAAHKGAPKLNRSNNTSKLSLWAAINYHREKVRYVDNWPPMEEMPEYRRRIAMVVRSVPFDGFMMAIILANLIVVVIETDERALGNDAGPFATMSTVFLSMYCVEIVCRVIVDQKAYFKKGFNWLDSTIVCADVILLFVTFFDYPSISTLRVLRAIRLLRIARLMKGLRELWLMMHGMFAAMKAMSWAVVLILIALLLFSIVSVDLLHPLSKNLDFPVLCTRCDKAFSSVFQAFWSWFLLIFAQQLWIDMASTMVDAYPATGFFFLIVFFTINLGVLNLMLTVIVDLAEEARHQDERQTLMDKKNDYEKARGKLLRVCVEMDKDDSGCLTAEEIYDGYATNADFEQTLQVMDVGPEDLQMVFEILDDDKSGTVTYEEFVEQLYKMKTQESHTLLIFMHHHLVGLKEKMADLEKQVAQVTLSAAVPNGSSKLNPAPRASRGASGSSSLGNGEINIKSPNSSPYELEEGATAYPSSQTFPGVGSSKLLLVPGERPLGVIPSVDAQERAEEDGGKAFQRSVQLSSLESWTGSRPMPGLTGLKRLKDAGPKSPLSLSRSVSPTTAQGQSRLEKAVASQDAELELAVAKGKLQEVRPSEAFVFEDGDNTAVELAHMSKAFTAGLDEVSRRLDKQHREIMRKLEQNLAQLTTINEI